jgi:hypothetical protein
MATGELYRSRGGIALGASDGLTIYEGTWRVSKDGLQVAYKLVDAEIRFTGYEEALKNEVAQHPTFSSDQLTFPFRRPQDGREFILTFRKASRFRETVDPRFVECSGNVASAPN